MNQNTNTQPLLLPSEPPNSSRCSQCFMRVLQKVFPCLQQKSIDEDARSTQQEYHYRKNESFQQNIQTQGGSSDSHSFIVPTSEATSPTRPKQPIFRSAMQGKRNQTNINEFFERSKSQDFRMNYPALQLVEDTLISVGVSNSNLLIHLSSIRMSPPQHILDKTQALIEAKQGKSMFTNTKLDQFWAKRYMLFEKFDYGIKLDEFSWFSAIPEIVSEYLAERVKCATILVGFSGIGSEAIKFSHTCHTVLTNDKDEHKLECLEHNASIYGVNNIRTLNYDFLELPELKADLIYISLINVPCISPEQHELIDLQQHFLTPFSSILQKSLTISNNIIVLLPPNINTDQLGKLFAEALTKSLPKNSSCSLQIEKLYFINSLKYLIAYYGPLANRRVKLVDELNFIYRGLMTRNQGYFEHKKLIKFLRERHGMVSVLKYLIESDGYGKGETSFEKFCEFIKDRRLISQLTLNAMLRSAPKPEEPDRNSQQEKFDGRESERTQSLATDDFESYRSSLNQSALQGLCRRTLQMRSQLRQQ